MAKLTKGPDKGPARGPAKPPAKAEAKTPKAKGTDEKENKPSVPLEKDELTEFRAQKRAEEEEGISRVIKDVTARKAAAASVSLENFDWDAFDKKGFGEGYSKTERESLLNLYSGTVATVSESEVVQGVVVGINDRDVILNIGFKSDGLVPLAEFKDTPNLKIGDTVDLFIEERENAMGQLVLAPQSQAGERLGIRTKSIRQRLSDRRFCEASYEGRFDRRCIWHRGVPPRFTDRREANPRFRRLC